MHNRDRPVEQSIIWNYSNEFFGVAEMEIFYKM